jgi:membrane protein DedA with SNARE-associated domain
MDTAHLRRLRAPLLWLAALRAVLGVAAIPLAPFMYREHFVVLVLLRPTKEVLLAGGFLAERGDVNLLVLLVAAVPLAILGVWHFYFLGRAYAKEIQSGKGLPRFAERVLPPKRIQKFCRVLKNRGRPVVLIGRLTVFPSSVLAAAAGASNMRSKDFFPTDLIGGALSIAEVVVAGYLLGDAYEDAGPWLTAVGVVLLFGVLFIVGRALTRER